MYNGISSSRLLIALIYRYLPVNVKNGIQLEPCIYELTVLVMFKSGSNQTLSGA